jgi:hypothetical protein
MQDINFRRMMQARTEHDDAARSARLDQIGAGDKPSPDTLMSIAEAELYVQSHHYEDGELIGRLKLAGLLEKSHQRLVHQGGQVVADARFDRVVMPVDPRVPVGSRGGNPATWTAQAKRQIRRDEAAG